MAVAQPSSPKPSDFFRAAWRTVKQVPGVFAIRLAYDVFAAFFRFAIVVALGLPFAAHFASHAFGGDGLWSWPESVLSAASRPESVFGLLGVAFVGWVVLFAAESVAAAGIWGAVSEVLEGGETTKFSSVFRAAYSRFPDAIPQRLLAFCADLTLGAVTVGACIAAYVSANWMGHWFDSQLVVPAAVWGLVLALLACCVIVIRMTVEFVAAPLFLDRVTLGEAMRRAAQTVVSHPVFVYRLFIVSAGILVVPLFAYWFAIVFQNIALELQTMVSLAMTVRFIAELAVMVGLAAFIVMLNASFFTYYAWWTGELSDDEVTAKDSQRDAPALTDLLPQSYDNVVDVDDLLGGSPAPDDGAAARRRPETRRQPADEKPPGPQSETTAQDPFDLDAILAKHEEE